MLKLLILEKMYPVDTNVFTSNIGKYKNQPHNIHLMCLDIQCHQKGRWFANRA